MAYHYADIAFTDAVKAEQDRMGSRAAYAHRENAKEERGRVLGADEQAFIEARDSFYMATVSETGWPYLQHRGGPRGFVQRIEGNTLGFADFSGNRQYVSLGNLQGDTRTALFFMDYVNRARLKLFAHARIQPVTDERLAARLIPQGYKAKPERFILLDVEAFDWNCPQHITPRYSMAEIEALAAMHTGAEA